MFTAGEIDKVMEYAGYKDGNGPITIWDIPGIMAGAQDCGVLDSRIGAWKVGEEDEFLITFNLNEATRLASRITPGRDVLGEPSRLSVARDTVHNIMVFLVTSSRELVNQHRNY